MVSLRGRPTRDDPAKSYYKDLVVCVMRGGFTLVEQTLLDGGRGAAVIEQRMASQNLMCEVFILGPTNLSDRPDAAD